MCDDICSDCEEKILERVAGVNKALGELRDELETFIIEGDFDAFSMSMNGIQMLTVHAFETLKADQKMRARPS